MLDTGENPDAPQPKEMIDLEVSGRNKIRKSVIDKEISSIVLFD